MKKIALLFVFLTQVNNSFGCMGGVAGDTVSTVDADALERYIELAEIFKIGKLKIEKLPAFISRENFLNYKLGKGVWEKEIDKIITLKFPYRVESFDNFNIELSLESVSFKEIYLYVEYKARYIQDTHKYENIFKVSNILNGMQSISARVSLTNVQDDYEISLFLIYKGDNNKFVVSERKYISQSGCGSEFNYWIPVKTQEEANRLNKKECNAAAPNNKLNSSACKEYEKYKNK